MQTDYDTLIDDWALQPKADAKDEGAGGRKRKAVFEGVGRVAADGSS